MSDDEVKKWFDDNNLYWVSEWMGIYTLNGNQYSIKNEVWDGDKKVVEWYSRVESNTERVDRSIGYVLQKNRVNKLNELGI